jgi:molybdopterin-containing oxidoreductase family iron-sulfur binding subunit
VRASEIVAIAAALLAEIGAPELPGGVPPAFADPPAAAPHRRWIRAVANDLAAHRGRSVIVAGDEQPPILHAIAWAINATLGNLGATVSAAPSPVLGAGGAEHRLVALADALRAGEVDTLLVLGTNAAYTAPADVPFGALVAKARESAYLGLHPDETSAACNIAIGAAHPLESWGDARAFDGTLSIVQPLIEPLLGGMTSIEVIASIAELPREAVHDRVRRTLASAQRAPARRELDERWQRALTRGVVEGTEMALAPSRIEWGRLAAAFAGASFPPPPSGPEIVFTLDPRLHDGRFAENAWLLELPEPITKLTWTNAATLGPATAVSLGVGSGDEVELGVGGRAVRAPALVVPGQAEGTIGLALGWGRAGERGSAVHGASAYLLRASTTPRFAPGATLTKTGARVDLPITQGSHDLHGRGEQILHTATLAEYRALAAAPRAKEKRLSLYGVRPPAPEQWAMAIDLTVCTGCGSCVVACQAENNVPTVGATGVLKSREMHWLRIDTYHLGDPSDPQVVPQPMLCQHCEMAPCEYVCPTNATVHSGQGLNEMVYNRCVGTRFCSNNCPYKVRRFNWFDYHEDEKPTAQLVHNPDVTVRARGVMEKCTFCVQRIREHEIRRAIDRGAPAPSLLTACQQACPTNAIVFGDKARADSEAARLHQLAHGYAALDELGTLPRVRYLARVRNPNPELA